MALSLNRGDERVAPRCTASITGRRRCQGQGYTSGRLTADSGVVIRLDRCPKINRGHHSAPSPYPDLDRTAMKSSDNFSGGLLQNSSATNPTTETAQDEPAMTMPAEGRLLNIILILVDSHNRDCLSTYNPETTLPHADAERVRRKGCCLRQSLHFKPALHAGQAGNFRGPKGVHVAAMGTA